MGLRNYRFWYQIFSSIYPEGINPNSNTKPQMTKLLRSDIEYITPNGALRMVGGFAVSITISLLWELEELQSDLILSPEVKSQNYIQ